MVENSPADLVMLTGDVAITVTREEHHQAVLAHYGPDRTGASSWSSRGAR